MTMSVSKRGRFSISLMLGAFILGVLLPTGNGLSENIICESDIQT